ncbi:hypothetical protein MKW98_001269, partial [Papaver atlanticum]
SITRSYSTTKKDPNPAFCIARPAATIEIIPSCPMRFQPTPRVNLREWKALLRPSLGKMQRFAI